MTTPCECEHIDHFEGDAHPYGEEQDIEDMTEIATSYGAFRVCVQCRAIHLTDAILKEDQRARG